MSSTGHGARTTFLLICLLAAPRAAGAQGADGPLTFADGRFVIGGDGSIAVSSREPGFFNYTDYDHDALRMLRLNVALAFRAASRVSVLAELRSENADAPYASALYVRIRPWLSRPIDIQAGRIPPNFGAFARYNYGVDRPLIGYPLAYQYLTSLRPDSVPASADDVLHMRGRGWLVSYPIGSASPRHGVPLVSAFRWDTGVQIRVGSRPIEASVAITTGTLSNPRIDDDNDGRQISARLAVQPVAGLVAGVSAARGAYIAGSVAQLLQLANEGRDFTQQALGIDAEYSRDYWLLRGEAIWTRWRLPAVQAPWINAPLDAFGGFVEGRYKLRPGLYVAGRLDRLRFSGIVGTDAPYNSLPWDAPVTRLEAGGGYYVRRNVIGKMTYQWNLRDNSAYESESTGQIAAQLVFWF
jgi:hypothetical protein